MGETVPVSWWEGTRRLPLLPEEMLTNRINRQNRNLRKLAQFAPSMKWFRPQLNVRDGSTWKLHNLGAIATP